MLVRLEAENFRLFRALDLNFAQGVPTVLIGPNASGKSTAIEILDLVNNIFFRTSLHEPINQARDGFKSIVTGQENQPIKIRLTFVIAKVTLRWGFTLEADRRAGSVSISQELAEFQDGKTWWPILRAGNGAFEIMNDPVGKTAEKGNWPIRSNQFMLRNYVYPDEDTTNAPRPKLNLINIELSTMLLYSGFDTTPRWAKPDWTADGPTRSSLRLSTASVLGPQGADLASVLYNMQLDRREDWAFLNNQLRAEFPFIDELVFPPEASGGKIAVGWRDTRFGGKEAKFLASDMSEGLLAYLCCLAALIQPRGRTRGVIALDEPDRHLHPSAVARLVAVAERTATKMPVLITTHSDYVLDHLSDVAASVRVCRATKHGASIAELSATELKVLLGGSRPSELRRRKLLDPRNEDFGSSEA